MWSLEIAFHLFEKDPNTFQHSMRVAKLAKMFAQTLSFTEAETRNLVLGCMLHDVGKLMVPQPILIKEASLTEQEYEEVKSHTTNGVILMSNYFPSSHPIMEIIQFHHERWDGTGYPEGRKATLIPFYARICAVLDAFDCISMGRPYNPQSGIQHAKLELRKHSNTQFDREIVEKLIELPESLILHYQNREGSYAI